MRKIKNGEYKNIVYDDVVNLLIKAFPDFKYDKDNLDLSYCIAGDFAIYLLECYKDNLMLEFEYGLDFIEILHINGDKKTQELAIIGFLEGIQNVWGNSGVNPELAFEFLGKKSKKMWIELNKFWDNMYLYRVD